MGSRVERCQSFVEGRVRLVLSLCGLDGGTGGEDFLLCGVGTDLEDCGWGWLSEGSKTDGFWQDNGNDWIVEIYLRVIRRSI